MPRPTHQFVHALVLAAWAALPSLSSALCLLPLDAGATLRRGDVHVQPGFVPPLKLDALRRDLATLAGAGRFERAASFGSDGQPDALRAAFTAAPDLDHSAAFAELFDQLTCLGTELAAALETPLASGVELACVIYPAGGYYQRHVDATATDVSTARRRRAFSFICYLNKLGWQPSDGGALRIHPTGPADRDSIEGSSSSGYQDILPEGGTLVLFDSMRVWHEVRPTNRERACLVGWFRHTEEQAERN